jgi:hypothetical protein
MDGLGDILGLAGSVASGGLFGLIGSGISSAFKYFQRKQEFKEQLVLREEDRKDFKQQMEYSAQETEQEIAIASAQGAWNGLNTSLDAASSIKGKDWSSQLLRLFRPFLTTLLVAMSGYIIWMVWQAAINAKENGLTLLFTVGELKEILQYCIYSIIFSASTAVVWWFGDRAMTPPNAKGR